MTTVPNSNQTILFWALSVEDDLSGSGACTCNYTKSIWSTASSTNNNNNNGGSSQQFYHQGIVMTSNLYRTDALQAIQNTIQSYGLHPINSSMSSYNSQFTVIYWSGSDYYDSSVQRKKRSSVAVGVLISLAVLSLVVVIALDMKYRRREEAAGESATALMDT